MATVEPEPARFDLAGFFAPASRRSSLHGGNLMPCDLWRRSAMIPLARERNNGGAMR